MTHNLFLQHIRTIPLDLKSLFLNKLNLLKLHFFFKVWFSQQSCHAKSQSPSINNEACILNSTLFVLHTTSLAVLRLLELSAICKGWKDSGWDKVTAYKGVPFYTIYVYATSTTWQLLCIYISCTVKKRVFRS